MLLNYSQTMGVVEKFMINSRIREYCTDICKGQCCNKCYKENKEACHRQEGRRLSCSVFLCGGLRRLFPKETKYLLLIIQQHIRRQYFCFSSQNCYFCVPSEKFFRKSRFNSELIHQLTDEKSREIKKTMDILIREKTEISGPAMNAKKLARLYRMLIKVKQPYKVLEKKG